ncbi:MAG TPA: aldo/keto reductase [Anaerolineaceae bacterium]
MRYAHIPGADLTPAVLCLGTGEMGATIDREAAFDLLDQYLDAGGNFIDTAKIYNDWVPGETSRSEKIIGAWIQSRGNRQKIILATKGAHPNLDHMEIQRLSPAEITADLEASLRHLQTDVIDLYWLHRDDVNRPVEEIVDTLNAQARAGKMRFFGCSNWRAGRIQAAQAYAARGGLQGFSAVQNLWNLAAVNPEGVGDPTLVVMDDALWKYQRETQLAAVPFTSQANGLFQKLETGLPEALSRGQRAMYLNPETEARYQRIQALKPRTGLTTSQIVLGYLTSQPFPTFPVIGPRTARQLSDSLTAADVTLTPEQVTFLTSGTV